MAASRDGVLVFDPTIAGVAGGAFATSGGGLISGAGVYYSRPVDLGSSGWSDVTDVIDVGGSLTGTAVAEVSNSSDQENRLGQGAWAVEPSIVIAAITAGIALVKAPRIGFGRMRIRFTWSAGAGTLADRRVVKAS